MAPLAQTEKWFKFLVYADHGVGKTELAGTAVDVPEMCDVLLVNAERGDATIMESARIKNKSGIFEIKPADFKTVAYIHDWLKAHCAARDANDVPKLKMLESAVTGVPVAEIEEPRRFRTVILDTLSEIESYSVYSILGIDQDEIIQDEMDVAGWPEFRKNFESVKLLIRAFRNLPMHVILLCQAKYKQDQFKKMFYMPYLTGQLAREVQGFVDTVGYMVAGSPGADGSPAPRKLFVQPIVVTNEARFDAKNRRASFTGSFIDNPTMQTVMEHMGLIKKAESA